MNPKVSLFASSVRPLFYPELFKSLESTTVDYEVVFAGNNPPGDCGYIDSCKNLDNFQYITTANIKPVQCYEIARRACKGEVIVWIPDDAEFHNDVIGQAYRFWKGEKNEKLILSIQTREYYLERNKGRDEGLCDMFQHTFTGCKGHQLMAPIGMASRKYIDSLGGIDRRYVCGQWDNDIVCSAYLDGAVVEVVGDKDTHVEIDHVGKNERLTGEKGYAAHNRRPFATGYAHDRKILETSWGRTGGNKRFDLHEPFEDKDILTISQSHKGMWE